MRSALLLQLKEAAEVKYTQSQVFTNVKCGQMECCSNAVILKHDKVMNWRNKSRSILGKTPYNCTAMFKWDVTIQQKRAITDKKVRWSTK